MPVFAVIIEEDNKIREYFRGIRKKLVSSSWINSPFKGDVGSRPLNKERLYILSIEPLYPRYFLNVILLFLFITGVTMQMIGFPRMAFAAYIFTLTALMIVNSFWSVKFYEIMLRVQLRRLLQRKVNVRQGTDEALRGMANGKV